MTFVDWEGLHVQAKSSANYTDQAALWPPDQYCIDPSFAAKTALSC